MNKNFTANTLSMRVQNNLFSISSVFLKKIEIKRKQNTWKFVFNLIAFRHENVSRQILFNQRFTFYFVAFLSTHFPF